MEIEKEVRYKIDSSDQKRKIIENTEEVVGKSNVVDVVMGWHGFNSLEDYGFICRIREKKGNINLECKKRISSKEWQESKIALKNFKEGYEFLRLLGMEPYLYINRTRQVRKYGDLLVYIDGVDMLGDFIEIEYQDSNDSVAEVKEFLNKFEVGGEEQKLYGDIFKEKVETDNDFKQRFNERLQQFIGGDKKKTLANDEFER